MFNDLGADGKVFLFFREFIVVFDTFLLTGGNILIHIR